MNAKVLLAVAGAAIAGGCGPKSARVESPTPPADTPTPSIARDTTPEPTPEAEPTPTPKETLTFVAAGDVTLGSHFQEWIDERIAKDGWSDELVNTYAFENVGTYFRTADVAFVNFEGTLTERGAQATKKFTFRARPELVNVLVDGGIDVVSFSNNHAWDYGDQGLLDTIHHLSEAGIQQAGAGRNGEEARTPAVLTSNGISIGFLAYAAVGRYDPHQAPTGIEYDTTKPGIAACARDFPCLYEKVVTDTQKLAEQVDVPVVSFHWGVEKNYEPEEFQVVLAHAAVDAGAKVVLGHHPHVLQGVEVYKGSVIFYSLGNFIFGGNWKPDDLDSIIARLTFEKSDNGTRVRSAGVVPIQISDPEDNLFFQPFVFEGAEADRVLNKLAGVSSDFERTIPALERRILADQAPRDGP